MFKVDFKPKSALITSRKMRFKQVLDAAVKLNSKMGMVCATVRAVNCQKSVGTYATTMICNHFTQRKADKFAP